MRRPLPHASSRRGPRSVGRLVDNERGVALVLALMVLLILSGLVLALLSASGFEPQISRNHYDTVRARYVAEAGIEYAYDTLATNTGSWNNYLAGATCAQGAILGTPNSNLPGLGSAHGTFTVRLRNDCDPNDDRLTGVSLDSASGRCDTAPGSATHDANCQVIVTSTGTIGTTTRTITVVVSKAVFPAINAALSFPGIQANVNFGGSSFVIDGRDTRLADGPGSPTGPGPAVYGIAVNGSLPTLAAQVENALANGPQNDVRGKDEAHGSATTQGANTIRSDGALTSRAVSDFVEGVRSLADVTIDTGLGSTYSIRNVGSACATDLKSSTCWGTTAHPKTVYIRGTPPMGDTRYPSLSVAGNSSGSGILIIENGTMEIGGNFRWDGPIIVTGRDVGIRYRGDGTQLVYGGLIVNESNAGGTTNLEGDLRGKAHILYSKEALDLVQNGLGRRLVTTHGWTDR
ncbi:MAG: hypothetical protein DMD99_21165 [Candidatus Rokuibacteriota bacterium]|nr:MAG: hypothetical protein DMD99_21165 [Candidatus Rokubacteria bacterium]